MPAWLFPIIFEEGGGQRDTIFLRYDEKAKTWGIGGQDTVFGEKYYEIDTSSFNAYWNSMKKDSIYKVLAFPSPGGGGISFHKGTLSLKIYWDAGAFLQ